MEIIKEEDLKRNSLKEAKKVKQNNFLSSSFGLFFLRIIFGFCLIMHGISKLQDFHPSILYIKELLEKNSFPAFLSYGVFLGEFVAPLCIIFGVFTRIFSLVVLINCLTILYLVYFNNIFALTQNGVFENEILFLYIGCALSLIFNGSGKFALKKS